MGAREESVVKDLNYHLCSRCLITWRVGVGRPVQLRSESGLKRNERSPSSTRFCLQNPELPPELQGSAFESETHMPMAGDFERQDEVNVILSSSTALNLVMDILG